MKNKIKVIIISITFLSSFVYLLFLGIKEGTMFYLEVSEFVQQVDKIGDRKVRISTLNFDPETHKLVFTLKDTKGPEILRVVYKGAPPDLMEEEGITLVAEGSYDKRQNVFVSKKLLVKCPSKYEKKEDKV